MIGAKLSEGLNFADGGFCRFLLPKCDVLILYVQDLARAVVIIGMPYANLGSPELQERMSYVNRIQQKMGKLPGKRDAADELYENLCMNAVNQSIGERSFDSILPVILMRFRSCDTTSRRLGFIDPFGS